MAQLYNGGENQIVLGNWATSGNTTKDIVVENQNVKLSDDKLYIIQLKTYELAEINTKQFRLSNLWPTCLSIAGTLLLTLLTSEFHSVGKLDSEKVTIVAGCLMAIFLVLGIVFLIHLHNSDNSSHNKERDEAIEKAKTEIIKKTQNNIRSR